MNILLIDDEKCYSQTIIEFLLGKNHQVYYCDNAEESYSLIQDNQYDLAIIDLMLPPTYTREGLNLLTYLKHIAPKTPVIMISQKSDRMTAIVSQAFALDIKTFLDKNDDEFWIKLNIIIKEIMHKMSDRIFISHGHNEILKLKLKDFLRTRLNRETVILSELPNESYTIVEKLENASKLCNLAIVLLTKDDEAKDGGMRARQNVIHEVGFFQGKYGRKNVILLCEKGVDLFSNISGILRLDFETGHFEEIYECLRKELGVN
jgi:predicted nucleotide-binding protein